MLTSPLVRLAIQMRMLSRRCRRIAPQTMMTSVLSGAAGGTGRETNRQPTRSGNELEGSHSAGPAASISGRRVSISRSITWISIRAMCAPRQKCVPPPPNAVIVRAARHVEAVRLGEHRLVAIRRAVVHDDLIPRVNGLSVQRRVTNSRTPHVNDWADITEHLFNRE